MRRREFILLGGGGAWSLAARAQEPKRLRHVGLLQGRAPDDPQATNNANQLKEELQKAGWTEGENVRFYIRQAAGVIERIDEFAKELIALKPDVIVAGGSTAAMALARETSSVPIVFLAVEDPIAIGVVSSYARPSANVTGFMTFNPELAGKWLEILREVAPHISRVALLFNPQTSPYYHAVYMLPLQSAAQSMSIQLVETPVHEQAQIAPAIAACARESTCGLVMTPDAFTMAQRLVIIGAVAQQRVPAIYPYSDLVRAGGLLSYGEVFAIRWRGAATYVDKILRGVQPKDLPIQAPTKFELAINLKTAKALGLTLPPALLARADEVIE